VEREAYYTRAWRELPRDGECVVAFLFGRTAGDCAGAIHRHHVDPDDPESRSLQVCASHHPKLQAALRRLSARPTWRRCPHEHRYPGARVACEARLNGLVAA
jgi:hypothetical protein